MFRRTIIFAIAILALAASTATAAKLITGKDIKNGTVTGADIKNRSLGVTDLSTAARKSLRGQTGPAGANGTNGTNGAPGAKGDKGDKGDRGPSDAFGVSIPAAKTVNDAGDSREVIGTTLAQGKYVLNAKFHVENNGAEPSKPDCTLGFVGGEDIFVPIDHAAVAIGTTDDIEEGLYTLTGVIDLDKSTGVGVRCNPTGEAYSLTFRDRQLNGIQVATLTATP